MRWLIRNWHLKLGALALAMILYTGFVYSGSFTEQPFPGLAVSAINQPDGSYPLTQDLGTVDVRYRLASEAERVTAGSFAVTVDLSAYDMERAPEAQALPIRVRALSDGLEVLSYAPTTVRVELDRLGEREVPVMVDRGAVPEGLAISTPQVSEREVLASGPESLLGRVDRAVAQVQIFDSGIDVEREVTLVPVDIDGRQVPSVELVPATVTVSIEVSTVEATKTVPVRPHVTGTPADGFEIASVTADPQIITLLGMPDALAAVVEVPLAPVSIGGASATQTLASDYVLPAGVRLASATPDPSVRVEIQAAVATRTLLVGVRCEGVDEGLTCLPQLSQMAVTLEGPAAALAAIDPADVTPVVDASGLGPGSHVLQAVFSLPQGVVLVNVDPGSVTVTIEAPATPTPAPA